MANFVGAIEQFNPYVQQIPTDAYVKVGMYKEHEYEAGVQKVQETIDQVAGLDIANEGGRQYLRNRVDELTQSLNKYSRVDFSNVNNVSQLVSLAKPLYQDDNIVNDVINTGVYRKWNKDASEAFKSGKMELGQYARESADASTWLNSKSAGSPYTGRQTPNTATKKELTDRIIKAKKDGIDQNEYVYDINYSMDTPYYVKSTNKYYSEADFNNFVSNNVMTDRDREMLMNEHWYENQGVATEQLQQDDIGMYQDKIASNLKQIEAIKNDPKLYSGDKKTESQQVIDNLLAYNKQLQDGKIKFLENLNLADPTSRDVFHRDLAESRYMTSLNILRNETKKEELQKNEQWFSDKQLQIEAAKNVGKGTGGSGKTTKGIEDINEVSVFTPVDPNAPKTELSLNVIQSGWTVKNDQINNSMNGLIGKLQQNGVDIGEYVAGWDQVHLGSQAGAVMNVPRFKNEAQKQKFYNLVAGLNYAYTKEAEDGHLDNQSFGKWVKDNFTDYKDDDPNSKFTLADKVVNDALNSLKGNSALLPKLNALFSDKGITRSLAQIDEALKDKKDMANAYRSALIQSQSLSTEEVNNIKKLSDDDLMNKNYMLDKEKEDARFGPNKRVTYRVHQETDGTYSIYQDIFDKDNEFGQGQQRWNEGEHRRPVKFFDFDPTKEGVLESRKIVGGYATEDDANDDAYKGGSISALKGISEDSLDKAEKYIKQTYSYVQENLNTTAQNLKQDKDRYSAFQDGLMTFIPNILGKASGDDLTIMGVDQKKQKNLTGIKNIEVSTFSVGNTGDIFNPNPMVTVNFDATDVSAKEPKSAQYTANVSLRSFLATNPDYKSPGYAQYFGPVLYAQKDAYERIKAGVNPLQGSEASYASRKDIEPVYNYTKSDNSQGYQYDDVNNLSPEYQWETIPIEKDGKQTMVSYQVVSLGQDVNLGNIKNKDGQQYAPGAYYVKLKLPTSTGKSQVIFLKKPSGDSYSFNSAANAHYTVRELIFNSPDIRMEEINPKTNDVNYFTVDPGTIRGIFNSQLSYNGFSKIETSKLRDALGREVTKQQIQADQRTYGR